MNSTLEDPHHLTPRPGAAHQLELGLAPGEQSEALLLVGGVPLDDGVVPTPAHDGPGHSSLVKRPTSAARNNFLSNVFRNGVCTNRVLNGQNKLNAGNLNKKAFRF